MEQFRKFRLLKGAVIGLLLFQFVLMIAMASSAQLHHALHCDAGHSDHQCEVTLFASGALDDGLAAVVPFVGWIAWEMPPVRQVAGELAITPTHLIGGVLAQGPARAP